jgi:hypothetical protein
MQMENGLPASHLELEDEEDEDELLRRLESGIS